MGSMVWGKLPGYDWWPGLIISYSREEGETRGDGEGDGGMQVWIKWYGESNLSAVSVYYTFLYSIIPSEMQQNEHYIWLCSLQMPKHAYVCT